MFIEPGAPLKELQNLAYDYLEESDDPTNDHIYFMSGICDLTKKTKINSDFQYEEVKFVETVSEAESRMTDLVDKITEHILFMGAKPCFATIIPMSLRKWNETRLEQGRTDYLLHQARYGEMQRNLDKVVLSTNKYLQTVNMSNQMETPHLESTVVEHRIGRAPRFHFGRLVDGVHAPPYDAEKLPQENLVWKWADRLNQAITVNRRINFPVDFDIPLESSSDQEN